MIHDVHLSMYTIATPRQAERFELNVVTDLIRRVGEVGTGTGRVLPVTKCRPLKLNIEMGTPRSDLRWSFD
jgi:hypothetical protein